MLDEQGRLLDPQKYAENNPDAPEDLKVFVSLWKQHKFAVQSEWAAASKYIFPEIDEVASLKRLDIYQLEKPKLQQATSNSEESQRIRRMPGWYPFKSLFVLNINTDKTIEIIIESAGPPRRNRFKPDNKDNTRDLTTWVYKETINGFFGVKGNPGTQEYFIDFIDSPDRYFISDNIEEPTYGCRRLWRFSAYPASQFYILEKMIYHDCLEAEGGYGLTYLIEAGPYVYAKNGWRLIGSFFGFDRDIPCGNLYTVYERQDPFPRMIIALGPIDDAHLWTMKYQFYAFDIPFSGTVSLMLQTCVRSVRSLDATVPRHRLCAELLPGWDQRLVLYVMPAALLDCSVYPYSPS